MIKFCIHERHVGVCAKTGGYCVDGFCPDEEVRDFVIADDTPAAKSQDDFNG